MTYPGDLWFAIENTIAEFEPHHEEWFACPSGQRMTASEVAKKFRKIALAALDAAETLERTR